MSILINFDGLSSKTYGEPYSSLNIFNSVFFKNFLFLTFGLVAFLRLGNPSIDAYLQCLFALKNETSVFVKVAFKLSALIE